MIPYYIAVGVLFVGYGLFEQYRAGSSVRAGWFLSMGGLAFLISAIDGLAQST